MKRCFDVFFDQRRNKGLCKHVIRRWFETPSCSLRRHYNALSGVSGICKTLPVTEIWRNLTFPANSQTFNINSIYTDIDLHYMKYQVIKIWTSICNMDKLLNMQSNGQWNGTHWSSPNVTLTHSGRGTHICVSKLAIIGSDNGLSHSQRQTIIWIDTGMMLIWTWGTKFSEVLSEIQTFSLVKMHLKMSSGKWQQFCLGLNVLISFLLAKIDKGLCSSWYSKYPVHNSLFIAYLWYGAFWGKAYKIHWI